MRLIGPRTRRITSVVLSGVAIALGSAATARAQQRGDREAPHPGWLPRRVNIEGSITAAQKAEAIRRLEAIEGILRQVPELAHPDTIMVQALFGGVSRRLGAGDATDPRNVLEYYLELGLCEPEMVRIAQQRPELHLNGCGTIEVRVNFSNPPGSVALHDARGREIYLEAIRSDGYFTRSNDPTVTTRDTVPEATEVYYRLSPTNRSWVTVLFTPDDEPFWTQITREELYQAVLFNWERDAGGKDLPELRKRAGTSPYREWLAGAAQRKKDREEALATAAAIQSPAELAKTRKMLEDTEREVGERLKAEEASGPDEGATAAAEMIGLVDSTRAELARMTAAERRLPAMVDATSKNGPFVAGYQLTDRESPYAERLFTLNYDFWHARRSPVEVRSLMVHINASTGSGPPPPSVHHVLWAVWKKLDWGALNQLLDRSRRARPGTR